MMPLMINNQPTSQISGGEDGGDLVEKMVTSGEEGTGGEEGYHWRRSYLVEKKDTILVCVCVCLWEFLEENVRKNRVKETLYILWLK